MENKAIFCWRAAVFKKKWHFDFFLLTQYHVGLEISKCYSSYTLHMISAKNSSSAWLCQQSYCYDAGVRRSSSVRRPWSQVSRKPLHGSRPNFVGSSLSTISPDDCFCLFVCLFQNFHDFIFIFVNMGPYGSKNATHPVFIRFEANFMIN